jgi:hypothetical protein
VTVTYEKSDGQPIVDEPAPDAVEAIEIAELDEEADLQQDEIAATPSEIDEPAEAEYSDPAVLLDESLEAFESSKVFWEQGNFDDAFAALDRSYELMAEVPPNGDPYIAQQKDDLRFFNDTATTEIYTSRQTTVGDMTGAIPLVMNEYG